MDGPAQGHRSPCSLPVAAGGYGRSIRELRTRKQGLVGILGGWSGTREGAEPVLKGGAGGWRQAEMVCPHPTPSLGESERGQPLSEGQAPSLPTSFPEELSSC